MCGRNTASIAHYRQIAEHEIAGLIDEGLAKKLQAELDRVGELVHKGHFEAAEDLAYDTYRAASAAKDAQPAGADVDELIADIERAIEAPTIQVEPTAHVEVEETISKTTVRQAMAVAK